MKVFTKMLSVLMVLALSSALVFGQSTNLENLKVSAAQNLTADIEPGVIPVANLNTDVIKKSYATSNPAKSELWNNGPLITAPGAGSGGTDYSALQDLSLSMGTYGFGCQISAGNSMADDFEVTGTWTVNSITFFSYQTGSGTTSTLNDVRVQIWDAAPNAGGTVIWGDPTTNLMSSTSWINVWRVLESAPEENRPIMQITANTAGLVLETGTYWVQWSVGGTGASGPWAPAVTIVGEATTGNGLQYTTTGWAAAVDGGTLTGQGFPFVIEGESGGTSTAIFEDNFDSYTVGGQLACQNPTEWTTWSNAPCGSEDAYISDLYAYSGSNSTVIVQNNDLVKDFGDPYTSGKYSISFAAYIPTSKTGYFNTLQTFTGTQVWGLEVYFNAGGAGSISAGGAATATFTWTPDVWFMVEHIVDMDMDYSEIWIDGNMIYSYQWSLGANGTGVNSLEANDFFGATANDQMYFDDYKFDVVTSTFGDPPTDLTAEVAGNDVYLNWDAPGGGSTTDFIEDFEGGSLPTGWLAIDNDNDGYNWINTIEQGFAFDAHGGTGAMTSASYDNTGGALTPDNWLITPAIDITDASELIYWHDAQDPLWAQEQYYVRVSTTGTSLSDFTETIWDGMTPGDWAEVTVDLSQFAGQTIYIAWNHTDVTDQFWMKIDDVTVTNTETKAAYTPVVVNNSITGYPFKTAGMNQAQIDEKLAAYNAIPNNSKDLLGYNVYRDGGMVNFTTATSYNDMDLADGTYEYYVTAVYDEGESEPSNSAFAVVFSGGGVVFEYDFEDYTAGEQVACENPTEWTTWSNAPCGTEDPVISTDYALSGVNSFKVTGTNDLVKTLGDLTMGHYKLSFNIYIPNGTLGYFNILQDFAGSGSTWGMQVYFGGEPAGPTTGVGWIDGGVALAASFNFDYDTWILLEADIDLDQDWAEFYVNGSLIHGYIWSTGTFGTGINKLDGINFYAWDGAPNWTGTQLYYIDDFMMEDNSQPPLPAPTNLVATVENDFDVHLTWNAPGGAVGLQGYNIYRNNANIDYVAAPTVQYDDLNLSVGTYDYYVKAVYPSGESPASNSQTVNIVNPQPPAPTNLVATGASTGVELTWDGVGSGQWIQWDDGVNVNGIGFEAGGTITVAARWTPSDLTFFDGFSLQKIAFFANSNIATPTATFNLKIWTGANGTTLVHQQMASGIVYGDWNEIVLTTPVVISSSTDLWIGYTSVHAALEYPAGCDDGPAIPGKGFMVLNGAVWADLSVLNPALNYNWNIKGFVGLVDGESAPLQPIVEVEAPVNYNASFAASSSNGTSVKFNPNSSKDFMYNVYHKMQGGTYSLLAGPMSETTYFHEYPGEGMHYYVVRTTNNGVESPNSNEASFLYTSIEEMVNNLTQVYPNPANGVVNIKSDFDIQSVKVFNHAGQTIANESVDSKFYQFNTSQFAPGLYMFQIETNEGTITKRIIVE